MNIFNSCSAPLLGDPIGKSLLQNIFPTGGAPSIAGALFNIEVDITDFENNIWHPRWQEKNVFRIQLSDNQNKNNPYSIRIGKGGQLYSIKTRIGELMPPQNEDHSWVDDCLLLTYLDYNRNFMHTPNKPQVDNLSGFIHQAGMYQSYDKDFMNQNTPDGNFFAPVVAEYWDAKNSQYSCITLGMTPVGPSYNRGDVLMYCAIRNIGEGVFEMQYMTYNYNYYYNPQSPHESVLPTDSYQTDITAWGGHRKTALPKLVMGLPDAPETYTNPFGSDKGMPVFGTDAKNTLWDDPTSHGGWFAAVQNLSDPNAYALSWIVGNHNTSEFSHMIMMGDADMPGADGRARDFEVMSLNYRGNAQPGTSFFFRYYYALGDISSIAKKSVEYRDYCTSKVLCFKEQTATTMPLFIKNNNGQQMLSESGDGSPAFYIYTQPVANSFPLFLIKNQEKNQYHITSDPYMLMKRVEIEKDYQQPRRMGFRPYDGTTEVVKLLGFVMPENKIDRSLQYSRLDDIIKDKTFYPQAGIYDNNIMVRITNH